MRVIIDNRETGLYSKCTELSSQYSYVQLEMGVLSLGDISIRPTDSTDELVLIERKSFSDLLASIKDGRYEEQSYRLTNSLNIHKHNIVYIIEGMFSQLRSPQEKKMVMSAIISLNLFKGFSVLRTSSLYETAELIMSMAHKIQKDISNGRVLAYFPPQPSQINIDTTHSETPQLSETGDTDTSVSEPNPNTTSIANYCSVVKKVKKENVTPENIGEIILCQIPGISSVIAIEIMKVYGTFPSLMEELRGGNTQRLEEIKLVSNGKSRKIPKNVVEGIKKYLHP
jgi:ERCC4-type nuclease